MLHRWKTTAAALALMTTPALAAQDSITLGMVLEPPSLDPTANAAAAIDEVVYANVFEGLTRFGPDGSIQPALAESWEVSEDGTSYLFHLRNGATFHDGAEFTAEDVVFSLDRARAEDSTNAQKALFAGITAVEAVDPATVRVTLSAADGMFPFKMAWGDAVMLDEASAGDAATRPVGTGPFRFGEWRQGDSITLEAFDGYWGDTPALSTATFRFIGDPTAAFAAMMAGDVDAFPIFPAPETLAQLEADPRFKVIVGTTEGETILTMNKAVPPLDDVRVREAIAHAINRQELIDGALFGYGTPIGTHFAPHHPDYVDLTEQSAYDPDRARELLAEAGAEDLSLRLALPPTPYARRGGELLAAQLRAVGIETKATNMEWAQWLETVFNGKDYDLTIISHVEPMDIGIYARPDYYFNYNNDELNGVMEALNAATDAAERSDLMRQAQTIIADDYANAYLFQLAKTGVANAKIEGLWENAPTPANDLTQVRWTE
ncbi:peptide/nickel transport system substrate-binding protein [Paracoccus isoporae]|uniref:Peptide/nickel transport system substrate-binding protein n=1 Tax=Paracoccus isoporae TaxID=591205 RepID=A0A1G7E263_9RHOB|nr:ABC transporter substrate-binding protein [Paracoccus isoporae]SDE57787.1 peptide/nickel transport system substrate-binding protein [Paracoccus isoporae]